MLEIPSLGNHTFTVTYISIILINSGNKLNDIRMAGSALVLLMTLCLILQLLIKKFTYIC